MCNAAVFSARLKLEHMYQVYAVVLRVELNNGKYKHTADKADKTV